MNDTLDKDFEQLPIEEFRTQILDSIAQNQILIIIGETGSGKTTKIPQFLVDSIDLGRGMIAITQPRRIAAMSVAKRVSEERGVELGHEVGYSVRFDDKTSIDTKIKYMTDGILIRELLSDKTLRQYQFIILDEAHERSLNTDILFGLLKHACRMRPDLKLIITSATLDTEKFGSYFNNCPILHVPGRVFPVDIYHSKAKQIMTTNGPANNSYIQSAVEVVMKIHSKEGEGHILVFLTGQEEIEKACALLAKAVEENPKPDRELIILPLYSALPNEAQAKVFQKPQSLLSNRLLSNDEGKILRKCVFATNIAETSITVPNVRFVVDAGYVKQKVYDPMRGIESLIVVPVSKIAALQRAGRAGRTAPGQCYRLYSSECYSNMMDETIPEIQRTSLASTVLYLKALRIDDVLHFDFLDAPSAEQISQALVQLYTLQALNENGEITEIGRAMSSLPLDPTLSRMLIESSTKGCNCVQEIAVICAMLCVENVWLRSTKFESLSSTERSNRQKTWTREDEMREVAHAGLRHEYGDLLSLWKVFSTWKSIGQGSHSWCTDNFINYRSLKLAKKIRDQLLVDINKCCTFNSGDDSRGQQITLEDRICDAITTGLYMNSAVKCAGEDLFKCLPLKKKEKSTAIDDDSSVQLVHIHPQSSFTVFPTPEYVVYQELVFSNKLYIRNVTRASRHTIKGLRKRWKYVSATQLSQGSIRENDETITSTTGKKRTREEDVREEVEANSTIKPISNSNNNSHLNLDEAKRRYLQRKQTAGVKK